MGLNSNDLMLQKINEEIREYGLQDFRYRLYKRAAECVVEEEEQKLNDDQIFAVIMKQIQDTGLSDERKEAFAIAITTAIAACRAAFAPNK